MIQGGRARARFGWLAATIEHTNDGIIATAGVVEGFAGAGAGTPVLLVAGVASAVAGAVALGGTEYGNAAAERDEHAARLAEEERQLALDPDGELAELAGIYRDKGLSDELATRVAAELTAADPLAAHAEAEHGISVGERPEHALASGARAAGAYVLGALVPFVLMLALDPELRVEVTLVVVLLSLAVATWMASAITGVPPLRPILRTCVIGLVAMVMAYLAGLLLHF